MSGKRRGVSVFRTLGSLIFAGAVAVGLLYLGDMVLKRMFNATAMSMPYYIVFALVALVVFVLMVFPANRPGRSIKNFLRWLLIIVLSLGIAVGGIVWNLQNEMMYQTAHYDAADEAKVKAMAGMEEITVSDRAGQTYHGWLWKNAPDRAGLVIYFGGNGEFAASSMSSIAGTAQAGQLFNGYNVLMVDNPGYGQSQGQPGDDNIYRMALAVWDHMAARPDVDPQRIVLAGWSLGTGPAARLAAEKEPAGLVLMAPFYDGRELINGVMDANILPSFLEFLVRNKYQNKLYARETEAKTLVIGAKNDRMIPVEQAQRLAKEYPNGTYLEVDGSHSDARFGPNALMAIAQFLQQAAVK